MCDSRVTRNGSVQRFAEVHTAEAVLLGPVGLDVPTPGVVVEVFGHGLVGVEPDLAEMETAGVIFGQLKQTRADSAALCIGPDGNVVEQQIARLGDKDGKPHDLAAL